MEQLNDADLIEEIKSLINEKGLDAITSKFIRTRLETKFNCDFEQQKTHLDKLTEQCISDFLDNKKEEENIKEEAPSSSSEFSDDDNIKKNNGQSSSVNSKKSNKRKNVENDPSTSLDEDMLSIIKRRRSAAPLPSRKRVAKQKEKKDKSGQKRQTQFTKICALSPELSNLLGKSYMRRSDVVKGVWEYLKSNNLQDPKKKQFYFLDENLKKVFGSSKTRFKAFGMMGDLRKHVKDVEFLDAESRRIAEEEIAKMLKEENKGNNSLILTEGEDEEGEEEEEESNKSFNKEKDANNKDQKTENKETIKSNDDSNNSNGEDDDETKNSIKSVSDENDGSSQSLSSSEEGEEE